MEINKLIMNNFRRSDPGAREAGSGGNNDHAWQMTTDRGAPIGQGIQVIPEPQTYALLAGAVVFAACLLRRRGKR